jgi:hypothetical protein
LIKRVVKDTVESKRKARFKRHINELSIKVDVMNAAVLESSWLEYYVSKR